MALFKISRGGEKNLPTTITDGWAYFTPDTKGFFIDVNSTVGGYSYNERIEINEKGLVFYPVIESVNLDGYNRYAFPLPKAYSGIDYDLIVDIDESQIHDIDKLFEYRKLVQKKQISYYLSKAQSAIIFQITGALASPIYLKATLTPKKRTISHFEIMHEGSYTGISIPFFSGSSWRELIENPLSTEVVLTVVNDNQVSAEFEHPSYGGTIYPTCNVNVDSVITPNYSYEFTGTCCFIAGTKVLMSDGSSQDIETVKAGDNVMAYNINTGENYTTTVAALIINKHSLKMAKIQLDNGIELEMTDYHPIYTSGGWKSLTGHLGYELLTETDIVKINNDWANIVKIEQYELNQPITTYTLNTLDINESLSQDDNTNDNFYANGVVVHNATTSC